MLEETGGTTATQTTSATPVTQPVKVDIERIERQAKYAALDPGGFDAFAKGYEAAGGTRLQEMRDETASERKAREELESRVTAVERDRALEKALRIHRLEDSDAELIAGSTPDEIMANAEKLARRIKGKSADSDDEERPARKREGGEAQTVVYAEKLTPREQFIRDQTKLNKQVSDGWPPRNVR